MMKQKLQSSRTLVITWCSRVLNKLYKLYMLNAASNRKWMRQENKPWREESTKSLWFLHFQQITLFPAAWPDARYQVPSNMCFEWNSSCNGKNVEEKLAKKWKQNAHLLNLLKRRKNVEQNVALILPKLRIQQRWIPKLPGDTSNPF